MCTQCHVNSLARTESFQVFSPGFSFLINLFVEKAHSFTYLKTQLHIFRRLEKCSIRLTKCEGAIEFLRICQNFNLTSTFAKVDETKSRKWKSSEDFQRQVVNEELKSKQTQLKIIREELRNSHDEIRLNCSTIRRVAIIRMLSLLQKVGFNP